MKSDDTALAFWGAYLWTCDIRPWLKTMNSVGGTKPASQKVMSWVISQNLAALAQTDHFLDEEHDRKMILLLASWGLKSPTPLRSITSLPCLRWRKKSISWIVRFSFTRSWHMPNTEEQPYKGHIILCHFISYQSYESYHTIVTNMSFKGPTLRFHRHECHGDLAWRPKVPAVQGGKDGKAPGLTTYSQVRVCEKPLF